MTGVTHEIDSTYGSGNGKAGVLGLFLLYYIKPENAGNTRLTRFGFTSRPYSPILLNQSLLFVGTHRFSIVYYGICLPFYIFQAEPIHSTKGRLQHCATIWEVDFTRVLFLAYIWPKWLALLSCI